MKKIKKYYNSIEAGGLRNKLASYSAMAATFAVFAPDAQAQCPAGSVVDADSNTLEIDIDGDGNTDLTLGFANNVYGTQVFYGTATPSNAGLPLPPYTAGFNTLTSVVPFTAGGPVANPLQTNWVQGTSSNFTIANTSVFPIFTGYYLFFASGIQFSSYFRSVRYFGTFTQSISINYAVAYAATGNQLVGLPATGSDACAVVGSDTGFLLNAGYEVKTQNYSYFNQNAAVGFFSGSAYGLYNAIVGTFTVGLYYFGNYLGSNVFSGGLSAAFSTLSTGPVTNSTGPNTISGNIYAPYNNIAVQFSGPDLDGDGNADTYYGWVTVSIDPTTSAMTVVGCDYNTCSVEGATANSAGGAASACINVGQANPDPGDCAPVVADIPTTGEWGLIILGLMMSITAIIGIRQRREEEAVA